MAIKIKQIIHSVPYGSIFFATWLAQHGFDSSQQYWYSKNGWLERISKGVYKIDGTDPTLYGIISSYNMQLNKKCIIGAYTALEIRGYSHYLSLGEPTAFLFTNHTEKLPNWILNGKWDMNIRYTTTSFLGQESLGVTEMEIYGFKLLVSTPERAILECLNFPDVSSSLLDIYYILEGMTTLRPNLMQSLLEKCSSVKVKRLFLFMAEKANHPWFKKLNIEKIDLGKGRRMISSTGKYIRKYNITVPREFFEYE